MTERAGSFLDGFVLALRGSGVRVPMEAQERFLAALPALPPSGIERLYWLARVTLVQGQDEIAPFDQVFHAWFREGRLMAEGDEPEPEGEGEPRTAAAKTMELPQLLPGEGTGKAAAADTLEGRRPDLHQAEAVAMRRFAERAVAGLPERRARRLRPDRHGRFIDLRRTVRRAVSQGGEIIEPARRDRPARKRPLVLLVDVSGSHKGHIDGHLRMARALCELTACEVFGFGSRLTRLTVALQGGQAEAALARAGRAIPDYEGGTRIGPALHDLVSVPRLAGRLRGAVVMVLSDGLERGDPAMMAGAVARIGRLAYRLVWLTPLAGDPRFQPRTRGLLAILPFLDRLGSAADRAAILAEFGRLHDLERPWRSMT
jgi:uncharacterized protein with von Willebrand factor type A (vWA) domain